MNLENLKKIATDAIDENAAVFTEVSDKIWEYAELSLKEFKSAELYVKVLSELGFEVEEEVAGIKTAFLGKAGSGRPYIGILGEFDALSGLSQVGGKSEKCELEKGGKAIAVKANVLEKDSLEEAKKQVLDAFGKVDILINGAGGNNPKGTSDDEFYTDESAKESVKSFFELDQAGIQFVLNLNFMGTLLPTQTFAPLMLNKNGVIINISSMNAYRPLTKIPAYSGAKAAISNFTQYLAVYFAKAGIRVNAIAPGFFVTHQNRGLLFNEDGTPTARTGKILNATPMGRFGEASELGGTLMWLVDNEAASFVTGIVVPVDGGFSAYSGV